MNEQDWNNCAWCDDSLETPSVKGKPKHIGGGRRMHECCYAVYRHTVEQVAEGELKLEPEGQQQLVELAETELNNRWVVYKANVADDDSQPYVSYSFMTENGASIELNSAVAFATEEEAWAALAQNSYCVRMGYFRPIKYAEAKEKYRAYCEEAEEFWREDNGRDFG